MNSNSKFHESVQSTETLLNSAGLTVSVMQAKINHMIKGYLYRKLSAQDELADISRVQQNDPFNADMSGVWNSRKKQLLDEIEFCNKQIKAYQENDDKAKIIPDRLL